jgi:exportin-2 (importin alpha re-exporter)
MEINDQNLGVLRNILIGTLSPDMKAIKEAETYIRNIEATQGFIILVLHLVSSLITSNNPQDQTVRLAGAVVFKNAMKRCWKPVPNEDGIMPPAIAMSDRDTIKTHLIDLMCTAPADVQRQLAEAVSIIAKHDLPLDQWESLLQQLVSKLNTTDISIIQGVMLTANSVMKKFRYVAKSDDIFKELIVCFTAFHTPMLEIYKQNQQYLLSPGLSKQQLEILLETRRLITRIFFSLNWLDLPEVFEDNIEAWMTQFAWSLEYTNPMLESTSDQSEIGPIERLHSAIIENLNLYASKYDEEFTAYLSNFTQLIWKLLMNIGVGSKYDVLATNAIKFLTSVASKQRNANLFNEQVLRDIVQHIVVRSLTANEIDEETFEDNAADYINKDMEGSDQDTRRRCATELVRALMKFFAVPVTQLCLAYVTAMLESYRTTMDWRAKDAALHLLLAVSVLTSTSMGGAITLNPNIQLMEIFATHILPEIHDANVDARPIVKADAIKLICIFRSHLQISFLLDLVPHLIRHLQSQYVVIQTYSAYCIERFLSIKDRDANTGVQVARLNKDHLMPFIEPLFAGLFMVFDNPDLPENDYVMKCIMRILSLLGPEVRPVVPLILNKLTAALERVCKNPSNPHFNHYLFESVALLVKGVCFSSTDPRATIDACNQFEGLLFPPFQAVLALDVTEFVPYVFQILAQLLSARPVASGLSPAYLTLFPPLLAPVLWERKGHIPALADLLRAYIAVGMKDIIAGGNIEGVLGVFQKLLASKVSWL